MLLFGVDVGLALGVIGLLVGVVIRMHKPKAIYQGKLGDTNLYEDVQLYKKVSDSGITVSLLLITF